MAESAPRVCPRCGTSRMGSSAVEDLCPACLLGLGLSREGGDAASTRASPPPGAASPAARTARSTLLRRMGTGVTAPAWAMPAELVRQAARRLRLACLGVGLAFAVSIVLNNVVEALGWHRFAHPTLKNATAAAMVAISAILTRLTQSGRFTPTRLLSLSLGYEVTVALAISLGDHLEPHVAGVPLASVSWLCVWIVIFPLVVPASPRRALAAGLASASTWPLAYLVGRALGNPPVPPRVLALDSLENYIAAGLAMFATLVIRRLQELGCYKLTARLDQGGMGEIWRARHWMLARPVAVKLIRPDLFGVKSPAEAAALVARFQREAEATAALHSAHTVGLHDFGVTPEGTFYYVMELLEGLDLETLVRRFGPVPPERAVHLLVQACDSLAEAHEAGLVHRDVKPANIMAGRSGMEWDFVKVLDFGLVRATWRMGEDDRLSTEGMIMGTPAYIAPEAALGGGDVDARVDLYGLGCVGYWLLAGERVFVGHTPLEVLMHHARTPPVPPSRRAGREIPSDLEALVLSCLAKDPDERPPSAQWVAARLSACATKERWTPERARTWWESHAPPAPADADPKRGRTVAPVASSR